MIREKEKEQTSKEECKRVEYVSNGVGWTAVVVVGGVVEGVVFIVCC